jgi:pyruvate/2-oxoglutarate dehydrogenase complex dihydrolipoamide dehydrogenase (E3) component
MMAEKSRSFDDFALINQARDDHEFDPTSVASMTAAASEHYDLVIVGMGSAGMTAAEFASTLDLKVAVIERGRIGGDCLWTGCVPSKALIASAKAAHTMRHADRFGIGAVEPDIDLETVWRRIRGVQAQIAATDDDPARYRKMGLDVIHGTAKVTGPNEVTIDGSRVLGTRFILLCTGSRPVEPSIEGLPDVPFITSESLFELDCPPSSVTMIGGGPIAVELAQAFARLNITTTVLQQRSTILPRDEPALVGLLTTKLRSEGVDLRLDAHATSVRRDIGGVVVSATIGGGAAEQFHAAGVVIAVGRRPNVDGLGLDELGIDVGDKGVVVDSRGRTSVRTVYAVGDIAGRYLFTHSAGYEGVRAVRDMFFPGKGTVDDFIPWCTFTDPELAHAGLTSHEAEAKYPDDVDVWRLDLTHSDRARTDEATDGAIVLVTARDRLVGAHILSPAAGELIHELALAIRQGMKLSDLAALVHVYPTLATSVGMLATESAYEKAQRYRWLVKRR